MAHLLHVYKGSTEFIWNNFDEVFIDELLKQTSKINKAEQDYIEGKSGTQVNVNKSDNVYKPSDGSISCNYLEDVRPTEEQLAQFKERMLKKGIVYEYEGA